MDENENSEYLEDVWDQVISDGLDYLKTSGVVPGSEEYSHVVQDLKALLDTKIKYTEAQMKYEDSEAQRKHELELKRMEYDIRMKELEAEEASKNAQIKNLNTGLIVEVAKEVLKGTLQSVVPSLLYNGLAHEVIVSEYQNNKFINSTSWRLASSSLNKSLKS